MLILIMVKVSPQRHCLGLVLPRSALFVTILHLFIWPGLEKWLKGVNPVLKELSQTCSRCPRSGLLWASPPTQTR